VQHVVEAARSASSARRVVVATDDARIIDALAPYSTEVVLTRRDHPNGTSRLAQAAAMLNLPADEIIVNVQADEPEIEAAVIDAVVDSLVQTGAEVATAASPIDDAHEAMDPNIVKVVLRMDSTAMVFSRAAMPHHRDGGKGWLRHVGIYAYRRAFLDRYVALAPTPMEQAESLEQLRVLEHGFRIAVAVVDVQTRAGIDTPEQYAEFVRRWRART
jgi:3-deoxy-manno-octulosonate cytidylyltransferase (CMP-KDO synthetase)